MSTLRFKVTTSVALLFLFSFIGINAIASAVPPQSFNKAVSQYVIEKKVHNVAFQWHDEVNGALATFYNEDTKAQQSICLTSDEAASLQTNDPAESVKIKIITAVDSVTK